MHSLTNHHHHLHHCANHLPRLLLSTHFARLISILFVNGHNERIQIPISISIPILIPSSTATLSLALSDRLNVCSLHANNADGGMGNAAGRGLSSQISQQWQFNHIAQKFEVSYKNKIIHTHTNVVGVLVSLCVCV